MKSRKSMIAIAALAFTLILSSCSSGTTDANAKDQAVSADILTKFQISQPVPKFDWSQIRQTLIDVETAQAQSIQTTSFFFNQGVQDPYFVCPSIGFPVAATTQLTNPLQSEWGSNGATAVTAQVDPNGVFSGNSTGTYVLCVNSAGQTYGQYAEAFVHTVAAPASWNSKSHSVEITGAPTYKFTTKK